MLVKVYEEEEVGKMVMEEGENHSMYHGTMVLDGGRENERERMRER